MRKLLYRLRKLNNKKGFSLLEVLVTIAIIGIVIVPIFTSFALSAKINHEASVMQNATLLAQSISEEFKALKLDSLNEEGVYGDYLVKETDAEGEPTGRLIYKNIGVGGNNYFKGAGGETFYVTVTLDPNEYKNVTGVNDYKIPALSDLYDSSKHGPIVLKSEIIKSDFDIYGAAALGINKSEADKVTKTTTVSLECEYMYETSNNKNYYHMNCYLQNSYDYNNGAKTYTTEKKLVQSYTLDLDDPTDSKIPPVYICYNTFDVYSTDLILGSSDTCKAKDKFKFEYNYTGDLNKEKEVSVYLAQQVTSHSNEALGIKSALDKSNVTFSADDKIKVFTNLLNWEGNELTSSDKTVDSLYKMTVTISKDEDGNDVITTFDSTKEN